MTPEEHDAERWVRRQAIRMVELQASDPQNLSMPLFYRSELHWRVLFAWMFKVPGVRELTEAARVEHWTAEHHGVRGVNCEACGWLDASVYTAQTGGRQLAQDLHGINLKDKT